jgi:hypothetical protein
LPASYLIDRLPSQVRVEQLEVGATLVDQVSTFAVRRGSGSAQPSF